MLVRPGNERRARPGGSGGDAGRPALPALAEVGEVGKDDLASNGRQEPSARRGSRTACAVGPSKASRARLSSAKSSLTAGATAGGLASPPTVGLASPPRAARATSAADTLRRGIPASGGSAPCRPLSRAGNRYARLNPPWTPWFARVTSYCPSRSDQDAAECAVCRGSAGSCGVAPPATARSPGVLRSRAACPGPRRTRMVRRYPWPVSVGCRLQHCRLAWAAVCRRPLPVTLRGVRR